LLNRRKNEIACLIKYIIADEIAKTMNVQLRMENEF